MKRKKKKITSDDAVVDWVFERICEILDKEAIQVVLMRFRRDNLLGEVKEDCKKHEFDGFFCVHINKSLSERGKWRIFFHETLHILFDHTEEESAILEGENLLWARMSEEQKQIIAWYFKNLQRK